MSDSIQEILKGIRKEFLKYCHHENRLLSEQCPKRHPKCKKKPDLDTTIARIAGQILSSTLHQASLKDLKDNFHTLRYLYKIVRLHKDYYPILTQLLDDTIHLIDYLIIQKTLEE